MLKSTLSVLLRQMIDRVDRTGDVEGTEAFLQSEFRMYTTEHIARMDEIAEEDQRNPLEFRPLAKVLLLSS